MVERGKCNIIVVGRTGAGKSSLIARLSRSERGQNPYPSVRPPARRRSRPPRRPLLQTSDGFAEQTSTSLYVRRARSLLSSAVKRLGRFTRTRSPLFSRRSFPSPSLESSEGSWELYDVHERGVYAVAAEVQPDVVLFVTRLDESRAAKADKLLLCDLERAFGDTIWTRTLFVLTRGNALPPADLTYTEFLRGRRDAIWRMLTLVRAPVPVLDEEGDAVRTVVEFEGLSSVDVLEDEELFPGAGRDIVVFEDPPAPEVVIAELSDSCPTNAAGNAILPDGTEWMKCMLHDIERVANRSPRVTSEEDGGARDDFNAVRGPRRVLRNILQRRICVLGLQIVGLGVLLTGLHFTEASWVKWRKHVRSKRGDVILRMSDAEYHRLTVEDIDTEPVPPELKPDELTDADDLFFGSDTDGDSSRGAPDDERDNTTAEEEATIED